MATRDSESAMLGRCKAIAAGEVSTAESEREANVCRLAGMVLRSEFPTEADRLLKVAGEYFKAHPHAQREPADVVREGWVLSLPRLRDLLSRKLRERSDG